VARSPAADRRLSSLYNRHSEKLRYLVVGFCNAALGYGFFVLLLVAVGPQLHALESSSSSLISLVGRHYYVVVQWLMWIVFVPVCTLTMRYFVFRSKGHWLRQIGRAYFVYIPAQALSSLLLWLTVRVIHLSPTLGQLVTVVFVTIVSYLGHKYFTFKTPLAVGEVPPEETLR
jgi:putative flippase GtrA